jgi:hypothetical protein
MKTKTIEVITGEKVKEDVDPSRAIEGKSTAGGDTSGVSGRLAEAAFLFECAWCGAINYAEGRRDSAIYACFACHRPMRPALE